MPEDRLAEGLFLPQSVGRNIVVRSIDRVLTKLGLIDRARRDAVVDTWMERLAVRAASPESPVRTDDTAVASPTDASPLYGATGDPVTTPSPLSPPCAPGPARRAACVR